MKKKLLLCGSIFVVCIISILVYVSCSLPDGKTVESREAMLDKALSHHGENWFIVKETEIDGYIISAAYNTNNKSTIAVFKPTSNGKYKFSTSTNRDSDEIIPGQAIINGVSYNLVWFNGAQTEYAEVIYTANDENKEILRYDTRGMDIICSKAPSSSSYFMEVYYYDSEGNKYE